MSPQWVDDLLLFICVLFTLCQSTNVLAAANMLGVWGGFGNGYHMTA